MKVKEVTSIDDLFTVLDIFEKLKIRYWVEGGWGVDILTGKQNRIHRDIDIDFDGEYEKILLEELMRLGYKITTDWRPCRVELYHPELGYLDVHPLVINGDGSAKQAAPDGGWYEFEPQWFSSAIFEGRVIPCFSIEAQKLFHSGYDLREVDYFDLHNLEKIFDNH